MNLNFFFKKKKNIIFLIKKISKKYFKFLKYNNYIKYNFKKTKYFIFKLKNNLQKKKIIIFNLINYFILKNYIIKLFFKKFIFFFKKKIIKKNFIISKILYLYFKKIKFYFNEIKIRYLLVFFEKKINFLKNNLIILKNNHLIFKEKIIEKNNMFFFFELKIFFVIINKINKKIINNNIKIINKNIKKYKNKNFFNDLYQECYLEFKKIIKNNILNKNSFLKFCYWKFKKITIRITNLKKNKKKIELLSVDKPLFNQSLKYFLSEKEKSILIEFARNALKNIIRNLIYNLPKKEQKIIRLRFGIGEIRIFTLEEIGKLCNLTKERIRQLELNVIIKIRQPKILNLLKPYIKILKSLE
ncbi:sigma-70 family RNA polymerase sigma factor [Candidatus Carsonella ruddii]|uniref:Putative RNA polymerase sigma factor rpoD n=1 Tax=Candidatus Carsonella ruddii HC isolate Thao2000 TaxID=1202538 RepID=J3VPU1_CARRU|nr:sigma-70 family RNA polymerase sigma factor [Candidatus Carsonella ruddii]AFP83921.1 putative RNA polymerase sigma factor rpoD [Candidatus Carsonella ruddii HC isolate Thao2000]